MGINGDWIIITVALKCAAKYFNFQAAELDKLSQIMSTWASFSPPFLEVLPIQVCEWSDACGNHRGLDYNHAVTEAALKVCYIVSEF